MQTYSFQVLSKDVKVPWLKRETWKEHAIYCKFWIALSSIFLWRLYFLTICVPIRHKTLQKRRPWGIARRFPTISRCLTNSQPCVGSLSADLETGKWQLDDHHTTQSTHLQRIYELAWCRNALLESTHCGLIWIKNHNLERWLWRHHGPIVIHILWQYLQEACTD